MNKKTGVIGIIITFLILTTLVVITNIDTSKFSYVEGIINKLEVLNPLNTLNRGYAIIKKDNKVLSSIKNINNDDIIKISLKDGEVSSKVIKVGE